MRRFVRRRVRPLRPWPVGTAARRLLPVALVLALATPSCSDDPNEPGDPVPASLVVVSGSAQSAAAGNELPLPLVVEVRDGSDNPLPGVVVNFVVVLGGGSVFAGAAETDQNGRAQDYWRLGTSTADSQRVEVRSVSGSSGAKEVHGTFVATALPGPVASVVIPLDTLRLAWIGDTTAIPASAHDGYGNPVPGAPLRYRVVGAEGVVAVDSLTGVMTAQDVGSRRLRAYIGGIGDTARALVAPVVANLEPVAETLTVNSLGLAVMPAVLAYDSGGTVIASPGTLYWRSLNAGIVQVVDSTTGVSVGIQPGLARLVVRSPTGVRDTARVRVRQIAATIAVSPPTAVLPLGDSIQLSAVAYDSNAVALPAAAFVWSSDDTTRVRVNASGRAFGTGYGLAHVSAVVAGVIGTGNVTVRNADTLAIAIAAGNGQADVVARTLEVPLTAIVTNQFDEPVADVPMVWWSNDGVLFDDAGPATGADGIAAVSASFDTVAGVKHAYATIGHDTVMFALTARPDAAASFVRVAPAVQSDTVGDAVPVLPRVRALDRFGNGVPDLEVRFSVRGGNVTGAIQVTGADGRARVGGWIADTIPGADTLFARIGDTLDIELPRLRFVLNTMPDSGSYMRSLLTVPDTVRESLNAQLSLQLVDRFGNLVGTSDGSVVFYTSTFGSAIENTDHGDGTYSATFVPGGARGATWIYARLDGDSVRAAEPVISRSYQLTWLGATASYAAPGNWDAPGGPPSARDSILITTATGPAAYPVLGGNTAVEHVTIGNGAQLDLGGFDLSVAYDYVGGVESGGLTGTGSLILTGVSRTVQGITRSVLVTGSYTMTNSLTVNGGPLRVVNGTLRSPSMTIRVRP